MLLSDRDIRAEIASGRLGIDPFDDTLVQPSSVDVRLDSLFRVFNNTRYTHIDPAIRQDDLTTLVEPKEGEPFVLHPGEFVLGATYEKVTLPEDVAAAERCSASATFAAGSSLGRRKSGVLLPRRSGVVVAISAFVSRRLRAMSIFSQRRGSLPPAGQGTDAGPCRQDGIYDSAAATRPPPTGSAACADAWLNSLSGVRA